MKLLDALERLSNACGVAGREEEGKRRVIGWFDSEEAKKCNKA